MHLGLYPQNYFFSNDESSENSVTLINIWSHLKFPLNFYCELEDFDEVEQSIQAYTVQQSHESNNLLPIPPYTLALGQSSSTIIPYSCSEHEEAIESNKEILQLNLNHCPASPSLLTSILNWYITVTMLLLLRIYYSRKWWSSTRRYARIDSNYVYLPKRAWTTT